MALQRYLDNIELYHLGRARTQVVEYQGVLDHDLMERAWRLLCDQYPVISAHVRKDAHGQLLSARPRWYPELLVQTGDEATLLEEVRRPWDPCEALARFMLVERPDGGLLALRMDHSVVDGHAWTAMIYELWSNYTDLVNGVPVPVQIGAGLPRPPAELFHKHFGGSPYDNATDPSEEQDLDGVIEGRVRLDEGETTRVIARARHEHTTVQALIYGAILASHRDEGGAPSPAPTITCLSPIDLRSRVSPRVGATETTNFLGFHMARTTAPTDANPVTIGMDVKRQLTAALAEVGRPPADLLPFLAHRAAAPRQRRHDYMIITSLGAMRPIRQPSAVSITDWRRLTGSNPDACPVYGVYTYDGRMSLLYFFPASLCSSQQVAALVGGAVTYLKCFATGSS